MFGREMGLFMWSVCVYFFLNATTWHAVVIAVVSVKERKMQLMCDILVHDGKSSACLNDEQKSLLATFDHKGKGSNITQLRSGKR